MQLRAPAGLSAYPGADFLNLPIFSGRIDEFLMP
jgi:hypothetical protein